MTSRSRPAPRERPRWLRAAAAVGGLLIVFGFTACAGDDDTFDLSEAGADEAEYRFEIPLGAGDALDAGAPLEILPAELDVAVGEVIEIVNRDERGHLVGPFFVGAGETLRQRFASPGVFTGECTVHPSGQIVVTVS